MPRQARVAVGEVIYHVINRANGRVRMFHSDKDYQHFESLLEEAKELTGMRILAYAIMPNHWHLVLYPKHDTDLSEFMRWLTTTHVRQRRVKTKSVGHGHLYQGTYKSFPVETNEYLTALILYVEQNPLRAHMVKRAEDWRWSSLWRRVKGTAKQKKLLSSLPVDLPHNYLRVINERYDTGAIEEIRRTLKKCAPYGSEKWTTKMVERYNMEGTLREPGRPKKIP
ncbi:MAG: hypothetical protein A3D65_03190 [Candidatus Lloydbacteria bacterium RIFCSPHIGHO2_02_FULL_50_13]|uniref:Transposase IS200-like domain-containing protein n=1 Tax=Candidatus Lloydbacteria bacterium RIFCSPHIGHO2_02_FULL_50_13 TaxID=1798661 RepID=A0A1G2D5F5_9BACT|nr:MAG: hypothetical protein A3D65_03190 [Candidatus Lloydbacteria bacterium RIFCSPHIGHO2_02_FULL_50_13]